MSRQYKERYTLNANAASFTPASRAQYTEQVSKSHHDIMKVDHSERANELTEQMLQLWRNTQTPEDAFNLSKSINQITQHFSKYKKYKISSDHLTVSKNGGAVTSNKQLTDLIQIVCGPSLSAKQKIITLDNLFLVICDWKIMKVMEPAAGEYSAVSSLKDKIAAMLGSNPKLRALAYYREIVTKETKPSHIGSRKSPNSVTQTTAAGFGRKSPPAIHAIHAALFFSRTIEKPRKEAESQLAAQSLPKHDQPTNGFSLFADKLLQTETEFSLYSGPFFKDV